MSNTVDVIKQIINLRNQFKKSLDSSMANNPKLNIFFDVRITFFSKVFSVMDSVTLGLIFADKYLIQNRWWARTSAQYMLIPPKANVRPAIRIAFFMFVVNGCFHLLFSAFESSVRQIAKKVDRTRYEKDDNFINIYGWFLSSLKFPRQKHRQYLKLLDVLRLIRNTIHNNGVYSPSIRKGVPLRNRQITYNGVRCNFIVNRPVKIEDFWELIFKTYLDVLLLMEDIINSGKVSSIKTQIRDPSIRKNLIHIFHPTT